ncbi:MAG: ImmA/IrrE family metallo-endopeptidase [Afipia sp.]|nr:ImmA/IrrE family metallo-endopeptidase [Afipia sp.]
MTYNRDILDKLLESRSLSRRNLSKRLGLEKDELEQQLSIEPEPRQKILKDIAKELAVPIFIFYMREAPSTDDRIPDFRLATPKFSPTSRETTEAIQLARSIQRKAQELRPNFHPAINRIEKPSLKTVAIAAAQARDLFKISLHDQLEATDTRTFYTLCRKKIEAAGIFVIQESFPKEDGSGFCLSTGTVPVLVVNTKEQTRGRRLFTLIHELAHALIGVTGISDPFVSTNNLETYCNKFASEFLAPKEFLEVLLSNTPIPRNPDRDDVKRISRKLKISQQATILRLEELGKVAEGSYRAWLTAIGNFGNPDFGKEGGGAGGPPPQEKVKLARYGFFFADLFGSALEEGSINDLQLFRATGLKPKYQQDYISFAQSLHDSDVRSLELGDE